MSSADPFAVVKNDVQQALSNAKALYARWTQLLESPGDAEEFSWTSKELRSALKSITWDLDDLAETISVVEQAPERFKMSADELASRKAFVADTKSTVKNMQEHVAQSKGREKAKSQAESRSALLGSSRYDKLQQEIQSENQGFIEDEQQRQQLLMREQDEQLGEVTQAIGVLRQLGETIGDELDDQNEMLEEFDMEISSTQDRLSATLKKLDRTLHITKDGKQSCCICLLLIILLILIIVYFT
eukprot:m.34876 g.34876  ORF g.34876 m.34876 type:complete len:244 (+) comp13138_c0_seq4:62-793(+)